MMIKPFIFAKCLGGSQCAQPALLGQASSKLCLPRGSQAREGMGCRLMEAWEAGWGREELAKPGWPEQLWSVRCTSGCPPPPQARGLGCQSAEGSLGGWAVA